MNQSKEHTISRYFTELFNQGKVELVDELLHLEYVNHSPGSPDQPRGREGVKAVVKALRAAFPDLAYTIEDLVVGPDAVAVRATMRGRRAQRASNQCRSCRRRRMICRRVRGRSCGKKPSPPAVTPQSGSIAARICA